MYRSRKVSLDYMGTEDVNSQGDEPQNPIINPVVIGVNIGPHKPLISSAQLLSNPEWVAMCKSDIVGVTLADSTSKHRETALELGRHTTERFNYHLSNRINNKDKHHHGAINFIKENLHVCDAITTLAGHVKIDPSSIRSGASLLRGPTCQAFQTVDEDDNGTLMGAYLHHDPISMEDFI